MNDKNESELLRVVDLLVIDDLTESDKEDLLSLFTSTNNVVLRNTIALIFSKLRWSKAVPYIIEKIHDKSTFNRNGTLVFALEDLNTKEYFLDIIRILCEQDYEARLMALAIIQKLLKETPEETVKTSLNILDSYAFESDDSKYLNSKEHFIDTVKKMIYQRISSSSK